MEKHLYKWSNLLRIGKKITAGLLSVIGVMMTVILCYQGESKREAVCPRLIDYIDHGGSIKKSR